MKFYIASSLNNVEQVQEMRDFLISIGHKPSYDWTTHGSAKGQGGDKIKEVAQNEMQGVIDADYVVVLLPGGRGTHTELGIALANEKPVYIYNPEISDYSSDCDTCSFYWLDNVSSFMTLEWLRKHIMRKSINALKDKEIARLEKELKEAKKENFAHFVSFGLLGNHPTYVKNVHEKIIKKQEDEAREEKIKSPNPFVFIGGLSGIPIDETILNICEFIKAKNHNEDSAFITPDDTHQKIHERIKESDPDIQRDFYSKFPQKEKKHKCNCSNSKKDIESLKERVNELEKRVVMLNLNKMDRFRGVSS